MKRNIFILILLMFHLSCRKSGPFVEGKVMAGGKYVSADTLNLGYTTYGDYCFSCHGLEGDGKGVASKGLIPPPRNFQQGLFKFGTVEDGGLLTDEDLAKIVRHGLKGSAMLPWDISDERLDAVIQYIKTFSPDVWVGADKKIGNKVVVSKDPFKSRKQFAIERGKTVYHVIANCQTCHRAYVSPDELGNLYKSVEGQSLAEVDPEIYKIKPQDSEYGYKSIPPDFTWHELKSVESIEDLYVRISVGVNGSGMPAWKGVLEDDDIWAVSYYVDYLRSLKGSLQRQELISSVQVKE